MYWKMMLCHLLSVLLVTQSFSQVVVAQPVTPDSQTLHASNSQTMETRDKMVERAKSFMKGIRSGLDRSAFDFEALLEQLDFDPDQIIGFAKNNIAFEQYPGVLRGTRGVMFSRAGNAIDQAIFLAKLLHDAGYDARVAGSEITSQEAERVLEAMNQKVVPGPPIGDADVFLKILSQYNLVSPDIPSGAKELYDQFISAMPAANQSKGYEKIRAATDFLSEQMKSNGLQFSPVEIGKQIIDEAREYYWVQYKRSASDDWQDLHPIFSGDLPFRNPQPTTYFAEEVPEKLQHRVRFQVFIERVVGGKFEVVPITTRWERPVANLVGDTLVFANVADSMMASEDATEDLATAIKTAGTFTPVFGSGLAPGARVFDLRGNTIDPVAAASPAAGLFSEINRLFGEAIGSIGNEKLRPKLTAQWMEIVLIAPDGSEQTFRRTTFDRIGPAARAAQKVPDQLSETSAEDARTLLQRHTISISVGKTSRGFGIEAAATHFDETAPAIMALLARDGAGQRATGPLPKIPLGWAGFSALLAILDQADSIGFNHRNFRSGPAVLIHSDGLGEKKDYVEQIDIVTNPRRAFALNDGVPEFDPKVLIESGVWETYMEGALFEKLNAFSTPGAFGIARQRGFKPVFLPPRQPTSVLDVSSNTASAIHSDLIRGYAVVTPSEELVPDASGWWRVNPQTGETLGQILDGRGAESLSYVILLTISVGYFMLGSWRCASEQNSRNPNRLYTGYFWDNQGLCCMVTTGAVAVASFFVGLFILDALVARTAITSATSAAVSGGLDIGAHYQPFSGQACEAAFGS